MEEAWAYLKNESARKKPADSCVQQVFLPKRVSVEQLLLNSIQ